MQRHFSNRGEALAELIAAKMLARRKPSAEFASTVQAARQVRPGQWFKTPEEILRRRKNTKPPTHKEQGIPML